MKEILQQLWTIVRNKYVATTLIFLVLIAFLSEYNLMVSGRLKREVRSLRRQEAELIEEIRHDSIQANSLRNNLEELERYGRENYYMKAEDEDIFVIVED